MFCQEILFPDLPNICFVLHFECKDVNGDSHTPDRVGDGCCSPSWFTDKTGKCVLCVCPERSDGKIAKAFVQGSDPRAGSKALENILCPPVVVLRTWLKSLALSSGVFPTSTACGEPHSDHRVTHKVGKNVFEIKEELGLFKTKIEIPHLLTVYSVFYLYNDIG